MEGLGQRPKLAEMMVVAGVTGHSFTIRWGSWFPFDSVIARGNLNSRVALVTLGVFDSFCLCRKNYNSARFRKGKIYYSHVLK